MSATLEGSVFPIGDKRYTLRGHAGQTMSLAVTSPYDHVFLSLYGSDGAVLMSVLDETTSWTGELPRTLEYMITLVSIAGSETTYTLQVDMTIPSTPTPGPTATPVPPTSTPVSEATPTPEARGVIYLTFDVARFPFDRWAPMQEVWGTLLGADRGATTPVHPDRHPGLVHALLTAGSRSFPGHGTSAATSKVPSGASAQERSLNTSLGFSTLSGPNIHKPRCALFFASLSSGRF